MATKPSLALIPSGYKANQLYSVLPSNGDGDFDFSRGSTATRINKDGLIENVDANVPRLNYPLIDGKVSGCTSLLLEPSSTNLLPNSEIYNTWNKAALSNSDVIEVNPQGTTSTQKITQTGSGGFLWYPRTFTGNETFSAFVKKDTSNFARLYAAGNSVFFDIVNGTIESELGSEITDKSIINYGNGWFRISISVNSTASNVRIYPASSGTSSNGTNSMFVWGAQLETLSYPTSYIPTPDTASSTRLAETASKDNLSDHINSSEGVLYAEIKALEEDTNSYKAINIGSDFNNRIGVGFSNTGKIFGYKKDGTIAWNSQHNANLTDYNKIAISFNTNKNDFWLNGVKVDTNTTVGDLSVLATKLSFSTPINTEVFEGNVKDLRVYKTALTDAELASLTTI